MPDMSKSIHRFFVLAFIVLCFVAGAFLNLRLRHLRESEAFYRWILAAATNERLFEEEDTEDQDRALFSRCVETAEQSPDLRDVSAAADAPALDGVSLLGRIASDYKEDPRIWEFARSEATAGLRGDFLNLAREQKLRFAQDIQYAEAQAGGVNVFNLFFGFRKVAANFVWIEVDRYWHQGNTYRMITLMRTCVALDPHFIEAFVIGAWHLAYNVTARMLDTPWPEREWHPTYEVCLGEKERFYYYAVDFLKEGARRNPRDYRLYFDLGFSVYRQKLQDYANAVKYLSEAVRLPHEQYVPRQLFLCQELNGQYEDALAGWKDYAARYPDSTISIDVAPRFILRNEGLILERDYEQLRGQAAQAGDPAEKARLEAQAQDVWQKARAVWEKVNDPFGEGRKARMDALELREEGRYLEAIAFLDRARWESSDLWQEFSDLIIKIKQEAKIPLTVSEKKAVLRDSVVGVCAGMPPEEREKRLRAAEELQATF